MSETQTSTAAQMSAAIDQLMADNEALKAEIAGAPAAIATRLAAAIAAQVADGVDPAQLQRLADLHTQLGGETTQLHSALAGTPPAPAGGPPPAGEPTPNPAANPTAGEPPVNTAVNPAEDAQPA